MSKTRSGRLLLALAACALVGRAVPATPAVAGFDHMKCYKVKDPLAKAKFTANLPSFTSLFPSESGCTIKVPAKLFCTGVTKSNVNPAPPLTVNGQVLFQDFACYKIKCPKQAVTMMFRDQFGERSVTIKAPNILCAPANFDA